MLPISTGQIATGPIFEVPNCNNYDVSDLPANSPISLESKFQKTEIDPYTFNCSRVHNNKSKPELTELRDRVRYDQPAVKNHLLSCGLLLNVKSFEH